MARSKVSSLDQFVEGNWGQEFFVGLDVHARSIHVGLRRPDGAMHTWVAPADPKSLVKQLLSLGVPIGVVAYEAGPTGFGLARELEAAGFRAIVAAPSRIPRAVTPGAKTDRLDCLKLAQYAAKGMLKAIAVPTVREEAQRMLLRRRHQIVDDLRKAKQRIKSLLLYLGIRQPGLETWSKGAVNALKDLALEPEAKETLMSDLRTMDYLQGEMKRIEEKLAAAMEQDHQAEMTCLRSVPGVGPVIAAAFLTELFRPERFTRAEEVASYLGLAPMVRQSGESKGRGSIRPVGQSRLRSLLVEGAWRWKSKDSSAQGLYTRLVARSGLPQKAITAVARTLAVILWRLSVAKRPYQAFCAA